MEPGVLTVFLDTHAAVFLWEGRLELFGARSRRLLEEVSLLVSPVVRLELGFLREVGKLLVDPDFLLGSLAADCGVGMSADPLRAIVPHAMALTWTRDPFDRLLVATALHHRAPFVTRDRCIRDHFPDAVW